MYTVKKYPSRVPSRAKGMSVFEFILSILVIAVGITTAIRYASM